MPFSSTFLPLLLTASVLAPTLASPIGATLAPAPRLAPSGSSGEAFPRVRPPVRASILAPRGRPVQLSAVKPPRLRKAPTPAKKPSASPSSPATRIAYGAATRTTLGAASRRKGNAGEGRSNRAATRTALSGTKPPTLRAEKSPALGAAARSFPSTWDRVRVFADQLPSQLSPAQWRFVASHYAGSQKATRSWVRKVRQLNPGFLMLHYQLAVGTGPAAFVVGDAWTNDFSRVTTHDDWFLHDDAGRRLLQPDWNWYVMDIRFRDGANGKATPVTGFPAYWLRTALERMRTNEDDGCFADSYTQDILMGQTRPPFSWFSGAEANWTHWLPHLNRYGAFCANGFHAQPERFYFLPNLGGLITTWDRYTNYGVGDGGMNEGFCASGPGRYYSDADWKLQMTRLLSLAARKKILLCQTETDPAQIEHRGFLLGSYLLIKGSRTYLNGIHKSTLEWYPEYRAPMGPPREDVKPDVSAYWAADWGVYRREYTRGIVLVNPAATAVSVPDLGREYHRMIMEGGGAVGEDGREPGRLTSTPTRAVEIPAHGARVLLNAPLP